MEPLRSGYVNGVRGHSRGVAIVGLLAGLVFSIVTPPHLASSASPPLLQHVQVASFDGTPLDGWILRPAHVERLPVILWSSPYFGTTYPSGNDPALWTNDSAAYAVPVNLLLSRGYAVAIFNVRGSGNSGGCFEWFGPNEQRDQAFLVEWLAARPWSNGRVGMMGLSYHGTTPWEAAVQNPPHLKTIVVAGMISDPYLFTHTPQGATFTAGPAFEAEFFAVTGLVALDSKDRDPGYTATALEQLPQRLCPEVLEFLTTDSRGFVSDRSATFWSERRLIDRFPKIRASVLLTHGFQDLWVSGHQSQESEVWGVLRASKREYKGQWGHEFPNFNSVHEGWVLADWNARLLAWLDYWLKGRGPKPELGIVSYQDGSGRWRRSRSWPPREARRQVLYLAGTALSPKPSAQDASFRAFPRSVGAGVLAGDGTPSMNGYSEAFRAACADADLPGEVAAGRVFMTEPLRTNAVIAGNPFAYLKLTSDQPGGQVSVQLVDVSADARCGAMPPSEGTARPLSAGAADLRFLYGNYAAAGFPVGRATWVRIDLTHLAEVIPAGHRLALVVSQGDIVDRLSMPYTPHVVIDGASEIVLPVITGSFGGKAPRHRYPPRPFLPRN